MNLDLLQNDEKHSLQIVAKRLEATICNIRISYKEGISTVPSPSLYAALILCNGDWVEYKLNRKETGKKQNPTKPFWIRVSLKSIC